MAKRRGVPEIVEHVVAALIRKGYSREQAWKIAVGSLQKKGILKEGSIDLTKKGRSKNSKHLKEPKKVRARKIALATGRSAVAVAKKLARGQ